MKKVALISLACLISFFAFSPTAFAHAHLVSSKPKAESTVCGPEVSIRLRFNSRVDSKRSQLDLLMPDGSAKPLKAIASGEAGLSTRANLAPGKYMIRWQALSIDGHITRGEIPFTVTDNP